MKTFLAYMHSNGNRIKKIWEFDNQKCHVAHNAQLTNNKVGVPATNNNQNLGFNYSVANPTVQSLQLKYNK